MRQCPVAADVVGTRASGLLGANSGHSRTGPIQLSENLTGFRVIPAKSVGVFYKRNKLRTPETDNPLKQGSFSNWHEPRFIFPEEIAWSGLPNCGSGKSALTAQLAAQM